MEITKEKLNLEDGLSKEWLITNGIGGFCSSTIIGANTRKYHGLLIAPLTPPARRYLILSKLDEAVIIDGKEYGLYTNIGKNYISKGYKYQELFKKEYIPIFTYKVKDVTITKMICMEYGKNTVGVYYKIKNDGNEAKLTIAPLLNFRDFHSMSTNHNFELKQIINKNKVKVVIDKNAAYPIYMKMSEGIYIEHKNDTFNNMFYIEEEKRGFYPEENHTVSGVFEIEIPKKAEKEISFVCSFEENIDQINVKKLIENEIVRQNEIYNKSLLIDNRKEKKTKKQLEEEQLIKDFITATDNFVVYRPSFRLHTLLAGYPWFLDWGRDSLISFEGLLLVTKRFDIAKEVLQTLVRDIKFGLVPNGYSGFDNRPLYNSVDASLLLFEQIQKYVEYTEDYEFVKENLYEKLKDIIENYKNGIDVDDNNIYLDTDYLIVSGTQNTQNTWMDAKCNNKAVTPRNGKAVEINSLWYNANVIMADLENKIGNKNDAKKYQELARKCKKAFNEKFYNKKRKCLYDVIGDAKIRPNQLFSMSLTYQVIDTNSEEAKNILNVVEKKLLNNYGLKTLAKGEENYVEIYEGDGYKRDTSYHQGITWPWLLGLYYNSLKNMIKNSKNKKQKVELEEKLEKFRAQIYKTFKNELNDNGCIGSIAELYDSVKPNLPKGAIAQGWSVAEVFRIILGK
ncbi:MAG TPA: glycogen debranching enzyme N-terminal domain-containing protein [Clostridiaceae bacterium]|jgi:alpha,alpha-trehalase|nr:glycogen debranching enzyme N-terminal domain-containing protein [Clostridiaceae bacterium]